MAKEKDTAKQGPKDYAAKAKTYGDVEKMALSILRKIPFEKSGVKDTPENRKDWDALVKEFSEMEQDGVVVEIPF